MKKPARDLKINDKIQVADQSCTVEATEISDIGKQGKRKVRLVVSTQKGEKLVLIRPEDYPLDVLT